MLNDEKYYKIVSDEIKENRINEAVWLKAMVEAKRDVEKAKIIYIKLRVQQLRGENIGNKINDSLEAIEKWMRDHTPEGPKITTINISARITGKGFFNSFKDLVLKQGMFCSIKSPEVVLKTKHGNIGVPTNTITKIHMVPNFLPLFFGHKAEIKTTINGTFRGKIITRHLEVNYKDGVNYLGKGLDLFKLMFVEGLFPSSKAISNSESNKLIEG